MKDIGNAFKEKREEMGISIEEAGQDLKIDSVLLDNLEDGNDKAFKDVLEIKATIKSYAKYLGIDEEDLMDEYNDYLFEKTSKISVEDIKEGIEKTLLPEKREVKSPYTIRNLEEKKSKNQIIILVVCLILLVIMYFILKIYMVG